MKKLLLWPIRFILGPTNNLSLAFGIGLGMISGLTPLLALHQILVIFLLLVTRINVAVFIVSFLLFSLMKLALAGVFNQSGLALLTAPAMQDFWTTLYNINLMRLSRFNNTQVAGSLAWSLGLFVPVVLLSYFLLRRFRSVLARIAHAIPWLRTVS